MSRGLTRTSAKALAGLVMAGAVLCGSPSRAATDAPAAVPIMLAETGFLLKLPASERVAFKGGVSFDQAGGAGEQKVYPASELAGLLVAVATHSAIVSAARSQEKTRLQTQADLVLDPYQEVLGHFSHQELMQAPLAGLPGRGERRLIEASDPGNGGWVVEGVPTFTMTQDEQALVLDHAVVVYPALDRASIRYQNVVRVVSAPLQPEAPREAWLAEQGRRLRQESQTLYAHSLRIILNELAHGQSPAADSPQRTFRYPEGATQRMERAQLLSQHCERVIVRTLRGWVLSVPAPLRPTAGEAAPPCSEADRPPGF